MKYFLLILASLMLAGTAHAGEYVALQKGKSYFIAVSPAKYDYPDYTHSTVVLFEKAGRNKWRKIGYQLLEPKWDTLGIAVIKDTLFILNHRTEWAPGILGYDINRFFEVAPAQIFHGTPALRIDNVRRPASINAYDGKIIVTFMGILNLSHGISIYSYKDLMAGNTKPEKSLYYNDMDMTQFAPADVVLYKGHLVVSNHYRGSISIFDLSSSPPTERRIRGGSANRLYYPLGMAVHGDLLYVADHIHYFVNVFSLSDLDNIKLVRSFGGRDSRLSMPYNLAIFEDTLFVTNMLKPQSISAYPLSASGDVTPEYVLEKDKDSLINAPSDIEFFRY